ncbi:MAG TPA: CDP-alcohol phosphatidyltransferase family protein [Phycisphaerae bacterium]|nr:CDP-alcohol phosphatidyltransferase family protein [Phycisphaerae bacterium]
MGEPTGKVRPWGTLNWPNRVSMIRLLLLAPFIVLVINQNDPHLGWARHAAVAVFALMAVSDFLDGVLARRLNARTRLGAILDPLADKALIICSVVLLSLPASAVRGHELPNWVVVAVVGKDLYVMIGFVVVYLVTDRFRVQPTLAGKTATFGQLVMVLAVLLAPDMDALLDGLGRWTALVSGWAVVALSTVAAGSYTRLGLRFIAEGQKPLDETNTTRAFSHEPDVSDR